MAATHLLFVATGASRIHLPSLGPLNKAVALYFGFSGANYCWGFFAPNMGSQFKTDFLIHQKGGTTSQEKLGAHGPNEVLLREAGIASTFWFAMKDQKVRRSLTASWAADVFARHPEAESVDVAVSAFYLASPRSRCSISSFFLFPTPGEAVFRAMSLPTFNQFNVMWMASYPWLGKFLCWSTLILEIGYPLFMWPRTTRRYWILGIESLHVGIALSMGLYFFSGVMGLMTFCVFGVPLLLDGAANRRRAGEKHHHLFRSEKLNFIYRLSGIEG